MVYPIYAYGQPVLRQVAADIKADYPNLEKLLADMWETMYYSSGVGLAAPQIGLSVRIFTVDTVQMEEKSKRQNKGAGIKKVFINAHMIDETGEHWDYEEGCLSIPQVHGDVSRKPVIRLRYMDENFVEHEETFDGMNARVIQHEYDHLEGILFTDLLPPLKKRLIAKKMDKIRAGQVDPDYRMRFAK